MTSAVRTGKAPRPPRAPGVRDRPSRCRPHDPRPGHPGPMPSSRRFLGQRETPRPSTLPVPSCRWTASAFVPSGASGVDSPGDAKGLADRICGGHHAPLTLGRDAWPIAGRTHAARLLPFRWTMLRHAAPDGEIWAGPLATTHGQSRHRADFYADLAAAAASSFPTPRPGACPFVSA